MALFKFRDYKYEQTLELEARSPRQPADENLRVTRRLFDKDNTILLETDARLAPAVFHEIFNWHEHLSAESDDLVIAGLNLSFEWGWFEKGELYYQVRVQSARREYLLLNWYQGQRSARLNAESMRKEFAKLAQ